MGTEDNHTVWSVHGDSVKGASHVRSGLPNQDCISWEPQEGNDLPIMLAVADGHGSATYFRSHLGAQFAIKIALEEMEQSIRELRFPIQNIATVKELLRHLPASIVEKWQTTVRKHWKDAMPTPAEYKRLQADPKLLEAFQRAGKNPLLPYGATLLCVIVTQSFIFYFQLGDGDIQIVTEDGHILRAVKEDARLLANETTSLCSTTPELARRDFRITFSDLKELSNNKTLPALILVSTDGYSNSFNTQEDFHKVGIDILHILSKEGGVEKMKRELPLWLQAATQAGSGDDISLGLIWNLEYTHRAEKALSARSSEKVLINISHISEQDKQQKLPETSPKVQNHASDTREQFWEQHAILIEDLPLSDQKAPGIQTLLMKSMERPPRERWEVEQYKPISQPASENDAAPSSPQSTIATNASHVATQTQDDTRKADHASKPNDQNEQFVLPNESIANNRQTDQHQEEEPEAPENVPHMQSTTKIENRNADDQATIPEHKPEPATSPVDERDETIIRPKMSLLTAHSNELLVKDVSMERRLYVRQHPNRGEYATISEALKHAEDGTLIIVHPGTYTEKLTVDQNITIRCEKDPGSVTIETKAPCLLLSADQALIHGIRFHGKVGQRNKDAPAIEITRGQSVLKMCDITSESLTCVHIHNKETNPTLQECDIHHGSTGIIFSDSAHGHMEQCNITENYKVGVEIRGSAPTIRKCKILTNREEGFLIWKNANGLIEDCLISTQGHANIMISQGGNPTISACRILAAMGPGIQIVDQGRSTIQDCFIQQNQGSGIVLREKSQLHIRDSHLLQGKKNGIVINSQSIGIIEHCEIMEHDGAGILLQQGGKAQIDNCTIHNNIIGVYLLDHGDGTIIDSQIANHKQQAIGVHQQSTITLKKVKIDHIEKDDCAVTFSENCFGKLEGCHIQAHHISIITRNHVQLHLEGCVILSKTSFALYASQESTVTIQKCKLLTESSQNKTVHEEDSHIRYLYG